MRQNIWFTFTTIHYFSVVIICDLSTQQNMMMMMMMMMILLSLSLLASLEQLVYKIDFGTLNLDIDIDEMTT